MLIQGKSNMRVRTMMVAMASMAVLAAVPVRPVAAADQPTVQSRVDRLEREMRAVQRKGFPGGNSEYFAPEIAPPDQNQPLAGSPASSPVATSPATPPNPLFAIAVSITAGIATR